MKSLLLSVILFVNFTTSSAQTDWKEKERQLWKAYDQNEITSEERHQALIKNAGSLGSALQVWFKKELESGTQNLSHQPINTTEGIALKIPNDWDIVKDNGNRYIKLYMINIMSDTAYIPRMDATVNNFSDFLHINGKWYKIRQNSLATCGNSYYNSKLKPNGIYDFEITSIHQESGSEEVLYKVKFDYDGQIFESNEVKVRLFSNQLKRVETEFQSSAVPLN